MRAKKSLGQHFLTSQSALRAIIETAQLSEGEPVLEIGPGRGVLTEELLKTGAHVIAIEKDRELVPLLSEKFAHEIKKKKLTLIEGDILDIPLQKIVGKKKYKVVANIPYYITGIFLRTILTSPSRPTRAVLLLQREVAKRIIGENSKESILSLSVKAYGTPHYVKTVPAGSFSPPPKIDSAVLLIEDIGPGFTSPKEEKLFFELIKTGFSSKRKKVLGNLQKKFDKNILQEIWKGNSFSESVRAEDVPPAFWRLLSSALLKNRPYSQIGSK